MMTLAELRDWLKTLAVAEHYSIGRIDGNAEKALGVFDRRGRGRPVLAIGGRDCTSYGVKPVSLLLHWNKNARETEEAAHTLWTAIEEARHVDLPGGGHIQCVRMTVPAPVSVGTDKSGVYEYVIEGEIYYRRRSGAESAG